MLINRMDEEVVNKIKMQKTYREIHMTFICLENQPQLSKKHCYQSFLILTTWPGTTMPVSQISPFAHHWRGIGFSASHLQQLHEGKHFPEIAKLVLIFILSQYIICKTIVYLTNSIIIRFRSINLKQIPSATAPYFSGKAAASERRGNEHRSFCISHYSH